jgi:hypothetical protein
VADRSNSRIVMSLANSTSATTISSAGKIFTPESIFITISDDIYVGNKDGGVAKHTLKTNTTDLIMKFDVKCLGLFVDIKDDLYCSMFNLHKVMKRGLNASTAKSTVVAGNGTEGTESDMLRNPWGIFVDINFDLYVADCNNFRIQLFRPGELNGITVAGSTSAINKIALACPSGIFLDADKRLFIVDNTNHRIVGPGPDGLQCLVGCNGEGSSSHQLKNPRTLNFDSDGNMFVSDVLNYRVQKFDLLTNSCGENI